MKTYSVVRCYFNDKYPKEIIKTGLSLEEAKEHCSDAQTSSETSTTKSGKRRTAVKGAWFDCWTEVSNESK